MNKGQIWGSGCSGYDKASESGRGGGADRAQTGVQRCEPQVELRYRREWSFSPAPPAGPLLLRFLQNKTINDEDPPALVWFKKPGECPRLRRIHKDHTAYCSGEVYSNTFKMIKSSHLGNNFSSLFSPPTEGGTREKWPPRSPDFELYTQSSINKYIHVQVQSRQKCDSETRAVSNPTDFIKTETS